MNISRIYLVLISALIIMIITAALFNHINAWVSIVFFFVVILILVSNMYKIVDWIEDKPKNKKFKRKPTKK